MEPCSRNAAAVRISQVYLLSPHPIFTFPCSSQKEKTLTMRTSSKHHAHKRVQPDLNTQGSSGIATIRYSFLSQHKHSVGNKAREAGRLAATKTLRSYFSHVVVYLSVDALTCSYSCAGSGSGQHIARSSRSPPLRYRGRLLLLFLRPSLPWDRRRW